MTGNHYNSQDLKYVLGYWLFLSEGFLFLRIVPITERLSNPQRGKGKWNSLNEIYFSKKFLLRKRGIPLK